MYLLLLRLHIVALFVRIRGLCSLFPSSLLAPFKEVAKVRALVKEFPPSILTDHE